MTFQVFRFMIRRLGSEDPWVPRFVAAKDRGQARLAMRLERMDWQPSIPLHRRMTDSQREVFRAIEDRFTEAKERINVWHETGFTYLVKRPGEVLVPLPLTLDPEVNRQDPEVILYDLHSTDQRNLAAIRLAHDRFRSACPLPLRVSVPSSSLQAAE